MKNEFELIQPWIPSVLEVIKRDIKVDHLPANPAFIKTHFGNRLLNRLKMEEIFEAYQKELLSGNASLIEWVVNRWVFKHGDIYSHFAERLSAINEDFTTLVSLTESQSEQVLQGAAGKFGSLPVYLFSVLNRVVFPASIFARLRHAAEQEEFAQKEAAKQARAQQTLEQDVARYQRELTRLHEKYEQKIAGILKKYAIDVEGLKKQIRSLQQKLHSMGTL